MSPVLDIEQIEWRSVADELPDVDTTCLVCAPGADNPVSLGFYDGVFWFDVGGGCYDPEDESEIPHAVVAWATMPVGVGASESDRGGEHP